ncbi:MAG TPA: SIS domain-containing protein, partial [Actinotalea sp.]|nr:SIS domain-containing protein [Actinotalea sp.]
MGTTTERYFGQMRRGFAEPPPPQLDALAALLVACVETGRTVYTFGNGASAALAAHMACDLGKGSASDLGLASTSLPTTPRLRIVSLPDNAALTTAYGNDLTYDSVFVEPLKNLLRADDVA